MGRPGDVGYPVRSIIREGMLYIHNFEPDRWPMCNPETGYLNTDGSPTKTEVLEMRESRSRPQNGIVIFEHRAFNQKDELVAHCKRSALMLKKPA